MKIIKLNLKNRSYNIIVGNKIINSLGKYLARLNAGGDAYIITNASIKNKYGAILNKTLKESGFQTKFKLIPDSEKSKSIETASLLLKDLALYDKKRRIFIIALGGGVVGDLAGFIASVYKRGVPYVQVPTTLLAQVDSSIGGKTAVDLIWGKNLVGVLYQPRLVFSDVCLLKTLDLKQLRAGLAEVIKYGVIKDASLFNYLEKNFQDILTLKIPALEFIVQRCSYIKAKIVQADEREEKKIRTILNFGHTLGHAIETASNYKLYNHGEAIALGMLLAADLSQRLELIDNRVSSRIENLIKAVGLPTRINEAPPGLKPGVPSAAESRLPTILSGRRDKISLDNIIAAYYRDKKFIGAKNRFVLLKGIGKAKIVENIPLGVIKGVLKKRS